MKKKLIYLASPYTHKNPDIVERRVAATASVVAHYMLGGFVILSPILHCHHLSKVYDFPGHFQFWMDWDFTLIDHCDEVWVLMLDGWKESTGVNAEIAYCQAKGKTVYYVNKEEIKDGKASGFIAAGKKLIEAWLSNK